MTSATYAMDRPLVAPLSARARFRLDHPLLVQMVRFSLVGAAGTLVNAVLYLVLRQWWGALEANLVALVLSTAISTEINRRFTFGADHLTHRWRAHVQNGATIVFYACSSSAVLLLVGALVSGASPVLETAAVSAASAVGGLLRFAVLRYWVFGDDRRDARQMRS